MRMHSVKVGAALLIVVAMAEPSLDSNVTIFDATGYHGQKRNVPVNGICENIGPPLYVHAHILCWYTGVV